MNEFSLIRKYFLPLTMGHAEALNLKDDAAVFDIPKKHELVVTSDTLSAGTHFLKNEKPEFIAHKALRVNLSDLAAMGAVPLAYQMCVAFPKKPSEPWIKKFTAALLKDQKQFGIFCSGGDTTITKGALTISITAFGLVPKGRAVKRSTAKPGDALVITGPIGGALVGLRMLQGKFTANKSCINAYRKPIPRLAAARVIRWYANAAIDSSDGLVADVAHICRASGCMARIDTSAMKFHPAVQKYLTTEESITGGDDYELALAVSQENLKPLMAGLKKIDLKPQIIGHFEKGRPEVFVFNARQTLDFKQSGWTHF